MRCFGDASEGGDTTDFDWGMLITEENNRLCLEDASQKKKMAVYRGCWQGRKIAEYI